MEECNCKCGKRTKLTLKELSENSFSLSLKGKTIEELSQKIRECEEKYKDHECLFSVFNYDEEGNRVCSVLILA